MTRLDRSCFLTINAGSSSLKFALFDSLEPFERILAGEIERIGHNASRLVMSESSGRATSAFDVKAVDHGAAGEILIAWLDQHLGPAAIAAIGHRVVHGGRHYCHPERITSELIEDLRKISLLDPDHLPAQIALIEAFRRHDPVLPQVACFDTAFHHDMPRVAQIVPIPRRYESSGVRRYGFHGLSYAYLIEELARIGGNEAQGRVILAHLGSGASLAAVKDGRCLDTTRRGSAARPRAS